MADVVKALALVVEIAAAWVRVPKVAAIKMDIGMTPCPEGAPMVQTGCKKMQVGIKLSQVYSLFLTIKTLW